MDLIDRLPPHNLRAEQGVLGSVLLNNDVLNDVVDVLSVEDFYRDVHQTAYRVIREMYDRGKTIDVITLPEELTRRGLYAEIGGDDFLTEIVHSVPHPLDARFYADIVRDKSVARQLAELGNETLRMVYSNQHTADELIEQAQRGILALTDSTAVRSGPRPMGEIAGEAMWRIGSRRAGDFSGDGLATGFSDVDFLTSGMARGSLVILAARPSAGKSALALQIGERVSRRGVGVLFVSLEMPGIDLAERMLVSTVGVSGSLVRSGRVTDDEMAEMAAATLESVQHMRLWIDEDSALTLTQIGATARRQKLSNGIGLVVVDYLQLITAGHSGRSSETRQEQVAAMSRGLKSLAMSLGVPVLCLSQLNRESTKRADRRPELSDLRESGAIEQDADQVWLLHRPDQIDPNDCPGLAELIVAKNRNGATGKVNLAFIKEIARFDSMCREPSLAEFTA